MSISQRDIRVDVFWDFGSCPAPANTSGHIIANKIRALALRLGAIKSFKAYLATPDHTTFSSTGRALALRSEIQSSGVSLIDVPGRKDLADKILIVDLLSHAFDNPSSVIMLISGDSSFAYALSILRMRNYCNLVLLGPRLEQENASFASQAALCLNWDVEIVEGVAPLTPPPPPREYTEGTSRAFELGVRAVGENTAKVPSSPPHGVIGDRRPTSFQPPPPPVKDYPATLPAASGGSNISPPLSGDDSGAQGVDNHPSSRFDYRPVNSSPAPSTEDVGGWDDQGAATGRWSGGLPETPSNPPDIYPASPTLSPEEEPPAKSSPAGGLSYAQMAKSTEGSIGTAWQWSPGESTVAASLGVCQDALPNVDAARPTPNFKPLIKVLKECRASGSPKPLWGVVAFEVLQKDPKIYEKSGVQKFIQYSELAVAKKIVQVGGPTGAQWMRLHPNFKG